MLYDDAEQIEVRHVISLAHHDVSIYGGGEDIPEGELYIKRNAICLSRREDSIADLRGLTPPFYLFSQSQPAKEDFYHALLKNQEKIPNSPNSPPTPQLYDVKDIVTLVQRLHSSEEHLQTRWINAVIGRLFLAMYKTPEMHDFVRTKITKKISRVQKPTFISRILLQKIDMGNGAPFITNPRLKDLSVDGDCAVEADVNYSGNFRIEISATARIDLGQRFKAREVDLLLAVVLKKLTGHVLIRFKPPPSNRLWFCFANMPDMTMSIEPIVSTRQITYGIILRAIESRIREVVAESLVFPFWDDVPFLDTKSLPFRGGIWEREISKSGEKTEIPDESEAQEETEFLSEGLPVEALKSKDDRTMSVPDFLTSHPPSLKSQRSSKSFASDVQLDESAASSSVDKRFSSSPPEALRSRTFSNVADPIVTPDHGTGDKADTESTRSDRSRRKKRDATSSMIEINSRSQPASMTSTPLGSPSAESSFDDLQTFQDGASVSTDTVNSKDSVDGPSDVFKRPGSSQSGLDSLPSEKISRSSTTASDESRRSRALENITKSFTQSMSAVERRPAMAAIGTATAAAVRKWGWNANKEQSKNAEPAGKPGTPDHPIGRGRPLPPPGIPLPPPDRSSFSRSNISLPRRKPVPPPFEIPQDEAKRPVPLPPLPKRKSVNVRPNVVFTDEVLVVEAPPDSEPNSPVSGPGPDSIIQNVTTEDDTLRPSNSDPELPQRHQASSDDGHSDSGFEQIPPPSLSEDTEVVSLEQPPHSSSSSSTSLPEHEVVTDTSNGSDHLHSREGVVS
jgi:hypothetical protein